MYRELKLTACSPFNDMDNLADPSTADVTSRVLELCTVIIRQANSTHGQPPAHLVRRAQQAVPGIIRFLASKQEADGSWWCRWAVNYVRLYSERSCPNFSLSAFETRS